MQKGRVSRWLCMYQQWTYWLHKECIRLNIFSPLTLGVITPNASLNFHGWVTEAMRGKKPKTQICHISFIIIQLEDRSVAPQKNKKINFLRNCCLSFLPFLALFPMGSPWSGFFSLPHLAFRRLETGYTTPDIYWSGTQSQGTRLSDQNSLLCNLVGLCKLGPEGGSNCLLAGAFSLAGRVFELNLQIVFCRAF